MDTIPLPLTSRGRRAPPIVLIHGFAGDRSGFADLQAALAPWRRTIALDLPGHGEAVDWPKPPSAATAAKAVIASLEAMGVKRASLVGHSFGGAVASLVALMRPDLLERLVLLAPGGFGPEINVQLLARFGRASSAEAMAAALEPFFGLLTGPSAELIDALVKARTPEHTASFGAILQRIVTDEGQGVLPLGDLVATGIPITLVWGLDDAMLPSRQAIAAPPEMARHLLPGVGHMPHWEAPELVARIVLDAIVGRRD